MVACEDDQQPLSVEAVARMAMGVPMKGLSPKSVTTPTNVPVAPAMASESSASALRLALSLSAVMREELEGWVLGTRLKAARCLFVHARALQ